MNAVGRRLAERPGGSDGAPPAVPRIAASRLAKKYCRALARSLRYGVADAAAELLPWRRPAPALRPEEFWALDEVSFAVGAGEALAVLGRNGAGKSTLLRILYGLVKPDGGEARLRGSVGAIIDLGTELDPHLTARENAALAGALAGLGAAGRRRLLDEAVAFAELEGFVDAPVRSYSSGMKARLAFALAAQLRPDILLVDEVLAVGDAAFQRKCVHRMRDFLRQGGSLVFVSHNAHQVQAVCRRGLLLEEGRVVYDGSAVEALKLMFERQLAAPAAPAAPEGETAAPFAIEGLRVDGPAETGKPLRLRLLYSAREPAEVIWGFGVWTQDESVCVTGSHDMAGRSLAPGSGELACVVPSLPLLPGRYVLRASIVERETHQPLALYGWGGAGQVLDVRASADPLVNVQVQTEQLVAIDVDWG